MKSLPTVLSIALILTAAVARAQSGNDKVQVSAIADVSAVQPGKPFWVGFKFTIEPGWHIYWKNPGDSGLATQVKLKLPDGFTAGEIQFPIPQRLVQPGDIVNYGYENQVMLLAQITPKKELPTNGSVKISAKTTWLVCKDDCMPGGSAVLLEIPIADISTAANEDVFKQGMAQLPMKEDTAGIAITTINSQLVNGNGHVKMETRWKQRVLEVHFIPGAMPTGEISKMVEGDNPFNGASTFDFDIKNKSDSAPITGLITFTKDDGTKGALEISILPESAKNKETSIEKK